MLYFYSVYFESEYCSNNCLLNYESPWNGMKCRDEWLKQTIKVLTLNGVFLLSIASVNWNFCWVENKLKLCKKWSLNNNNRRSFGRMRAGKAFVNLSLAIWSEFAFPNQMNPYTFLQFNFHKSLQNPKSIRTLGGGLRLKQYSWSGFRKSIKNERKYRLPEQCPKEKHFFAKLHQEKPQKFSLTRVFLPRIPFLPSLNTRHIFYDSAKTQRIIGSTFRKSQTPAIVVNDISSIFRYHLHH